MEERAETVGVERGRASEPEQGHGTHEVYPEWKPVSSNKSARSQNRESINTTYRGS